VFQEGWLRWSGVVIVIPAAASGDSILSGCRFALRHMAIMTGNRDFSYRTPAMLDLDVILVADELVRPLLGSVLSERLAKQICVHPLRSELHCQTRAQIDRLLGGFGGASDSPASGDATDARQREPIRRLTATLLLEALPETRVTGSTHRRAWVHAEVMRRALEYIHDHLDGAVDVPSVCHAVRVSRRHLQKCFETVLGVNPAEYVQRQRLLRARHILLERRDRCRNRVTAAAIESGFGHLGRFAAYHRRMFGESPHRTAT
jgi:transcriptional regulator GlxA family with amidase domain